MTEPSVEAFRPTMMEVQLCPLYSCEKRGQQTATTASKRRRVRFISENASFIQKYENNNKSPSLEGEGLDISATWGGWWCLSRTNSWLTLTRFGNYGIGFLTLRTHSRGGRNNIRLRLAMGLYLEIQSALPPVSALLSMLKTPLFLPEIVTIVGV